METKEMNLEGYAHSEGVEVKVSAARVNITILLYLFFFVVGAVVLFNYYSVSLADYISSSVIGSIIALVVLILIVGLIIKILTKNDAVEAGVAAVLLIAVAVIYFAKKSVFEGLLPNIMKTLSLFERFYTFVNGVFDMTVIVFYLSVIVFFLFLCVQSFEKRRYN